MSTHISTYIHTHISAGPLAGPPGCEDWNHPFAATGHVIKMFDTKTIKMFDTKTICLE